MVLATRVVYLLPVTELETIVVQADKLFPREASGLLVGTTFGQFTVLTAAPTRCDDNTILSFRITTSEIAKVAASLKGSSSSIVGCFHSHVIGPARPSRTDCAALKALGDLWMIYATTPPRLNLFSWTGLSFQRERFRIVPLA